MDKCTSKCRSTSKTGITRRGTIKNFLVGPMSNVAKAALPVRHDRATSQALRRHDTSFRASRLALHRVNYCNRAARHYKCSLEND